MAATHAAAQRRADKASCRARITSVCAELAQACNHVPAVVIDGPAQVAVAWRDAAESALAQAGKPPPWRPRDAARAAGARGQPGRDARARSGGRGGSCMTSRA